MYAVLYCALVCWLGVMTGLVLITGFLGLAFAFVCAVVYVSAGRQSSQQDALLWALAVTAERGMPMAQTFDVFAGQCWGKYRRKVHAAAHHLRQGSSLPDVIASEPRLFPRDAEVLIRVANDCGRLGAALREAADLRARVRGPWLGVAVRFYYLMWVTVAFQAIATFMSYFILPKFEAIFNDFGVPLPGITILTIEISHFFIKYAYVLLPLFLLELAVLGLGAMSTLGVLPWDLPLVGHIFYRRHTAVVLRCLAQVVDGNQPMAHGIQALARTYPVNAIRFRLRGVAREVEAGQDWCASLLAWGLIRPAEASLLEAAKRLGNLSWTLRQAAENSERRLMYQVQLWVQWLVPLLVLALGALVFVMAVAYFTPLLVLIEKLAS
jgi:type II secretory pathway component PulF